MKSKLLLAFLIGSAFVPARAGFLAEVIETIKEVGKASAGVAKDSVLAVKKNTWDAPVGKAQHGGKIIIGAVALMLVADHFYCKHVNKKYKQLFDKACKFLDEQDKVKAKAFVVQVPQVALKLPLITDDQANAAEPKKEQNKVQGKKNGKK